MGCWVVGLVGCWIVELDCWIVGLLVCCSVGLLVCCCPGLLECYLEERRCDQHLRPPVTNSVLLRIWRKGVGQRPYHGITRCSLVSGRIMGCTTDDEHDHNNDADDLIVTTIWISLDCES